MADPDQFEKYRHPKVDNLLEQHPADHWSSMNPQQQESYIAKMNKAAFGSHGRKIRNTKSSALYQPQAEVLEVPNALPELISAAPTPAEVSGDDTETDETESNGEEQPTDQYGVKVPKKPIPRNGEIPQNRIVSEMPVVFDPEEIGIRKHVYRKTNKNDQTYLGMDMDPNPKKAHWDQNACGYNSAKNKKEDLDQELVRAFKIHPTYGLPLPSSVNPAYDECEDPPFRAPTNWQENLASTKPTVAIEETAAHKMDEDKKVFLTSRSEWIMRSNEEWDEVMPRFKMSTVLAEMGVLERPEPRPKITEEESIEPEPVPQVIQQRLLDATNAETQRLAAEARQAALFSPPAPPPPAPTRMRGYDPVRDTTYQTPYAPRPQPPLPPPPRADKLNDLADFALRDMAENRAPMVHHPHPYHHAQRNSWQGPPPPVPRYQPGPPPPPPPQRPTFYTSFTPVNAPYAPPRPGAPPGPGPPGGQLRALAPAPMARAPLPPQPRQWYPREPPYPTQ